MAGDDGIGEPNLSGIPGSVGDEEPDAVAAGIAYQRGVEEVISVVVADQVASGSLPGRLGEDVSGDDDVPARASPFEVQSAAPPAGRVIRDVDSVASSQTAVNAAALSGDVVVYLAARHLQDRTVDTATLAGDVGVHVVVHQPQGIAVPPSSVLPGPVVVDGAVG